MSKCGKRGKSDLEKGLSRAEFLLMEEERKKETPSMGIKEPEH